MMKECLLKSLKEGHNSLLVLEFALITLSASDITQRNKYS